MTIRSPFGGGRVGADITGDAEFITINTVIANETGDFGTVNSAKRNLVRLMQHVMQVVNINYLNVTSAVVDLSDGPTAAFYGLGTDFDQAATTVYTIKFVAEQKGFVSAAILADLLQGEIMPFETAGVPITGPSTDDISVYETVASDAKNVSFTVTDNL